MPAITRSHCDTPPGAGASGYPEIAICESRPGTAVFLESGNTEGWIASDLTVDVTE